MCATSPRAIGRPRWGWLYGTVLPPLAGLAVVEAAGPPNLVRTLLRSVLALAALVGMALWVRANRAAFDLQEWCDCASSTITVRVIESRRAAIEPPSEAHELLPATTEREFDLVAR
jgi:hypothetical protein